jgi:hypothetical protein
MMLNIRLIIKFSQCLTKYYTTSMYEKVAIHTHVPLNLAIGGSGLLASCSSCLTSGERRPLDKRLGGPQSRFGRCAEVTILGPTGAHPAYNPLL